METTPRSSSVSDIRPPAWSPIAWSLLMVITVTTPAVAEIAEPGITGRASMVPGATRRGRSPAAGDRSPWMQGRGLEMWRAGGARLAIERFAGDVIEGIERGPGERGSQRIVLHPLGLVGMRWRETRCTENACQHRIYRVVDVSRDTSRNTMPEHGDNHDVWLHRIEYSRASDPGPGDWSEVCEPGTRGERAGVFVDGQWARDGSWTADGYTFSCPTGVIAKCLRAWGYKPWKTLPAPGRGLVALRPLHLACTRAARADYCGDGVSHTRDGTLIDMFDVHGFNVREPGSGFTEESIFSERGAEYLRHIRIAGKQPACGQEMAIMATRTPLIYVWSGGPPVE